MRRPAILLSLALSFPLLVPSIARADQPGAATTVEGASPALAPDAPPARVWYGWQPLLVDASSVATLIAALTVNSGHGSSELGVLGVAGFVLGSPIIHLVHEHLGKAGASLVLRTVAPAASLFTGFFLGAALSPPDPPGGNMSRGWSQRTSDEIGGGVLGLLVGAIAAVAIDDAMVARENAPRPRAPDSELTIEPRVSSVRGGATFGVGGTF